MFEGFRISALSLLYRNHFYADWLLRLWDDLLAFEARCDIISNWERLETCELFFIFGVW